MPLVRVEVRNEYALGAPELYREANKEDPKEILEGVAVTGLVGVLRQLGDLAEFAAEVFHGLQEEVIITSSRSNKLMARVQRIEAVLSPLEKAVLAQRSHLHFAYTAGSNWHARIRRAQNHFIYSDVPQFIMDSYEDCRGPPRLDLLDRFDSGGPGSCLKRYSDPTFFKRASVASGEAGTEKVPKDKKSRNIKKRRSWPRNGKVSRYASFSYDCDRMQFTQLNIGGHASPAQTASTYDATLRSDFGEQSNLDLRNGSYIEGDFRPSYSVQSEGQVSRESISSPVKRHDSDYLDYNFLEEKNSDAHEISQSQEQVGCSSSSVTWDGKRETLEPTAQDPDKDGVAQEDDHDRRATDKDGMTQEVDHIRHLESLSSNLELEDLGDNAVDFEIVEEMDAHSCNQAMATLESGDVHLDDLESEIDHFMDALNTIESEVETDTDCTKKQEVENCAKLEDKEVSNEVCELRGHNLESQSSNSESNVLANGSLMNGSCEHNLISASPKSPYAINDSVYRLAAEDAFNSVPVVDKAVQSSQRAGETLTSGSPQSDSYENGNIDAGNNVESVSCIVSSNCRDVRSGMPNADGTRSSAESIKHAPETSNATSVTFWTNGGLLGLQPSKPPDFGVANALPQHPVYKKDGKINSSIQNLILSDRDAGIPDQIENSKNIEKSFDTDSSTCHEYQESGTSFRKTSWKISPADLDIDLGKFGGSLYQNNARFTGSSATASGSYLPVNSIPRDAKNHQENSRSSSRISELSNRLLSTGSSNKLLPGGVENSSVSHQNDNAFEERNPRSVAYRTFSGRSKDIFGGEYSIFSPSSSPPLEHMKISFRPIDGFEISKLKLKFPNGIMKSESGSDIFPSFQLVPEVAIARQNVGSDSDSDTFYRSSPSLSDDCHSNRSESNSEQWESSESPTSKDRDLYDALRRISLTESVSTAAENSRTNQEDIHGNYGLQFPFVQNGMQNSESSHSFDRHSFETINHSFRKELKNDTNTKVPTALPPLPPVQWRGMTPHVDGIEDKCEAVPEGSYYAFDNTLSTSTISQPKPAPFNADQTNMQKRRNSSSQKSNGQKEANQGKCVNEKDDFLHQIRTKSFNLRPTVTTKPAVPSGASPTVPVTTILEKANAIRQAVGSDGEDNWSDT